MSETRKLAAILVADIVGYSRLARALTRTARWRAQRAAQRSHRPRHRRPSRSHRQAHRRRRNHRVPQRCRRGALRDRSAERPHRAQRRRAARAAHRVSRRHSPRRRGRGERRRSDGRRRQYRRPARRHRPAWRDLPFRGRLSAGETAARSRGQRSRLEAAQEHRRADPRLFAGSRPAVEAKPRGGDATAKPAKALAPKPAVGPRVAARRHRRPSASGRRQRLVLCSAAA